MENKTTVRKTSWFRRGVFRRHVLRKGIGRAALVSVLAIFLLVGRGTPTYAAGALGNGGWSSGGSSGSFSMRPFGYNFSFGSALTQILYGKTIDMQNAPDRSAIPEAKFSFEVHEVPEGDEAGIGQRYQGSTPNVGGEGPITQHDLTVYRGTFKEGSPHPVPLGQVSFHPGDQPQEELLASYHHFREVLEETPERNIFTSSMNGEPSTPVEDNEDYYWAKSSFFSDLLKYGWGEMICLPTGNQGAYFRPPTEDEKSWREAAPEGVAEWHADTWPEDTIGWKTSQISPNWATAGSYGEGDQCLWEYDFSDFNYVETFHLRDEPGSYELTGIHKDFLLSVEKTGDVYDSITKPIFGVGDEAHFIYQYVEIPEQKTDFVSPVWKRDGEEGDSIPGADSAFRVPQKGIYRYYLKESASDNSSFNENTETKILDVVVQGGDKYVLLFDNADQANEHYENYISAPEKMHYLAPQVTFTNTFAEVPKEPETRDLSVTKTWVGEGADQVVVHLLADGEEANKVVLNKDNG